MFRFINIKIFLVSLAIGLLFVYLSSSGKSIIYVYPTPDNIKEIEYIDKAGNCFQYDANQIACPVDLSHIKNIPIQN